VTDPNRRDSPGSWPRDRPVRWGALGRNVSTFVVTTIAFIVQFALVIPVLTVSSEAAGGWLRTGVALVWGAGTLWAAWCWVTGQTRSIVAPVVTGAVIWLAWAAG
jgi:hypothetical protein